MKSYKDFEKVYLGHTESHALVFRSVGNVSLLRVYYDAHYEAYECFGNVEIPEDFVGVFQGYYSLMVYDDIRRTYYGQGVYKGLMYRCYDVYHRGANEFIIHWHD